MGSISNPAVRSPADVIADQRHAEYAQYNAKRHAIAFAACMSVRPDTATRVLDVGNSEFTAMLRGHYREVWTLGFPGPTDQHIVFNLNDTPYRHIEADRSYDLITFNEVIEHLHTAPETVLSALARLLRPGGHMVLQTPNAAALNKRLMLLIGKNPFERLRVDHTNPGHQRELTKAELAEIADATGFDVVDHRCMEYCGVYGKSWRNRALPLLRAAAAIWPTFARSQQIVLLKRP